MTNDQKVLKAFVERRHPDYAEMLPHWEFVEDSYEGGRDYFADGNLFRYHKEGDKEFEARLLRAYRFNHSREVVDLVNKYLFKNVIFRREDAPPALLDFWKNATLDAKDVDEFMHEVDRKLSIFGRMYVVVDSKAAVDGAPVSVADEKAGALRRYAYLIDPKNAVDMSFDENGVLNWILIHEQTRDDKDPIFSSGQMLDRYRLWERDAWTLFEVQKDAKGKVKIVVDGPHPNALGEVPVIVCDAVQEGDDTYSSPALIDDVAYLDRAVANYLSNLDAIIQDQTFSQLAIPAQGLMEGDDTHQKIIDMGTKRIFTYNAEGGAPPAFISPDVKQAELIMSTVNKIIGEIYHTVGMAGERTKNDSGQGVDNASGAAKAYDFERMNSVLSSRADALELIENRIAKMVAKYAGVSLPAGDEEMVEYPDDFDTRSLIDEFEIAARLSLVDAPDTVRRTQMESLVKKLWPQIPSALLTKIEGELKTWPPEDPLLAAGPGGQPSPNAVMKKEGTNVVANKLVKQST